MADGTRRQNRLAGETSPYLLQHSANPVDWYPWGAEALQRARAEDKPILLSIGYAACHWCHVMERESFENDSIARSMNENFVCVKVDREERPDLDEIYMSATVVMTGHGGWPMTVFLTPEQKPFFAGTYFPPTDQLGRPGFKTLLERIAELWKGSRSELMQQAAELTRRIRDQSRPAPPRGIDASAIARAVADLERTFDEEYGGFGSAPKFPPCAALSLLLRHHRTTGDPKSLAMVTVTLDAMKNGGIYDHLGGGFARYSTDAQWLVPHFEKMLYDNAQLARVYLECWQVTKNPEYERVARETLDYVVREMQDADGGYYSATDADSEGVEGKFFVWTPAEVYSVLGDKDGAWFCAYYDVTTAGNWEGVSVLNTPRALSSVAEELGTDVKSLQGSLATSRAKLYAARAERVPPLLDDKVLTSWNGLMIGTMAEGARVLAEERYRDSALRAAERLLTKMARPDGGLYRTARAGKAHLEAYLEDYAYLADALLDVYEAAGRIEILDQARALAERMLVDFSDPEGGFFNTGASHEKLIVRTRDGQDGALPSANAVAARTLCRLSYHLGRNDLREKAAEALSAHGRLLDRAPRAFATALAVVDFLVEGPLELVFAGTPDDPAFVQLLEVMRTRFLPNRVVGYVSDEISGELSPLLEGKEPLEGRPTLFVCRDFVCQAPVTDAMSAADVLDRESHARARGRASSLARRRLAGHATAEGTARFARRFESKYGAHAYTRFGSTGWTTSRFGFGGYRIDDRSSLHRAALEKAIREGVQLIDTSTNYGDGHSERLIGESLAALVKQNAAQRDEIIVVTKVGYVQGQNLALAEERQASGRPFEEMVPYDEELMHCIHPEWLNDQLTRSLERLDLDTVDVCLLHNPEYFLSHAHKEKTPLNDARTEFYRRLGAAFAHLEEEVKRGRIRAYGVSSNTLVSPATEPGATDLGRMLEMARGVAGDEHHFKVVQLPMNLFEPGALFEHNTGPNAGETALEFARQNDVAVLVNRPLNAIVGRGLLRLAEPPHAAPGPPFDEALSAVRDLEAEYGRSIAAELQTPSSEHDPSTFFRWAGKLEDIPARLESPEQWRDIESHVIAPQIGQYVSALDRGLSGPMGERWSAWRDRYLPALEGLLASIRHRASERGRRRSDAIVTALDGSGWKASPELTLSQRALLAVASAPGVTTVLVGMRDPEYVRDTLQVMGETASDPASAFRAAGNAPIPST